MKKTILPILSCFMIMLSCNDIVDLDNFSNSEDIINKVDYLEKELKNISKSGFSVLTEPNIRTVLYDKISNKFDGDYNVLIEDLMENVIKKNIFSDENINVEAIRESIVKIKNSDDITFNAHIHIPFFEDLKSNDMLGKDEPTIIFAATDDPNKEYYQGYRFEINGSIIESEKVNEEFAKLNEVWVFGINERFFEETIDNMESFVYEDFTNFRLESSPYQNIVNMKVKCHKESFAAGASEVNIISYVHDSGFNNGDQTHGDPPGGSGIRDFSRKEVKNETWINVNYGIVANWNDNYPSWDWCSYVIFEYDPIASNNYVYWSSGGVQVQTAYRSSDTEYYSTPTAQYKGSSTSISVNCIEFTQSYN